MYTLISKHILDSFFGRLIGGGKMCRCTMHSDILGKDKNFMVYLPQDYESGTDSYPVLYLFHQAGGSCETWRETGRIKEIADEAIRSGMVKPLIVVMPDGAGEGEYNLGKNLGFFSLPGYDYEKYFHKELIPLVDSTFRTVTDKTHRAVAGPSMGGEAAVAYAQKYSSFYGTAAAISGILGRPEQSRISNSDPEYGKALIANNPALFVQNASPDIVETLKTVRWYADCGDNDFFYQGNVDFFLAMRDKGIPMDFRMRGGVHSWFYWITGLTPVLVFFSASV